MTATDLEIAQELLETIEDLTRQFAHQIVSGGVPSLTAGGLSALEGAFEVLCWSDPYPCPEQGCEHPGCTQWATCGTPEFHGYKRLCNEHYRGMRTS
jgi:hypothetical protein